MTPVATITLSIIVALCLVGVTVLAIGLAVAFPQVWTSRRDRRSHRLSIPEYYLRHAAA
ncbi:MAG: hypothetical protein WBL35_12480 [Ornithinibacter sp.]